MNAAQRRKADRAARRLMYARVPVSYPAWFGLGMRRVGRVVEINHRGVAGLCVVKFQQDSVVDFQPVTVARLRPVAGR